MVIAELGKQIDSTRLWKPTKEITPEDVNRIAKIAGFWEAEWQNKPYDIVKTRKEVEGKEVDVDVYIYTPLVYSGTITINGGSDFLHTVFKENPDRKVQAVCAQHYEGGTVQMHNLREAIVSLGDRTILFAMQETSKLSPDITTIIEISYNRMSVRKLTEDKHYNILV